MKSQPMNFWSLVSLAASRLCSLSLSLGIERGDAAQVLLPPLLIVGVVLLGSRRGSACAHTINLIIPL